MKAQIEKRLSECREAIQTILSADDPTDEQLDELKSHQAKLPKLEIQYRAAIDAEESEKRQAELAGDDGADEPRGIQTVDGSTTGELHGRMTAPPEVREFVDLACKADTAGTVAQTVTGSRLHTIDGGAMAELRQEVGAGGHRDTVGRAGPA